MRSADYTQALSESDEERSWKTAHQVNPGDFSSVTRRLRYQAGQLGLQISIQTDRQNRTVSFRAWKLGTCPAHGSDCPNPQFNRQVPRCPIEGVPGVSTIVTIVAIGAILWMVCSVSIVSTGSTSSVNCLQVVKEGRSERSVENSPAAQRLYRLVLRSCRHRSMGCPSRRRRATNSSIQARVQVSQIPSQLHLDVPHRTSIRSNT